MVVACGGTEAVTVKDGGADAQPAGDSGSNDAAQSMDATQDTGGDVASEASGTDGGCTGDWSSCLSCLMMQCSAELAACNADTACKAAFPQLASCESMCGMNCDNIFEVANQIAKDVIDCGANNCVVCEMQLGW